MCRCRNAPGKNGWAVPPSQASSSVEFYSISGGWQELLVRDVVFGGLGLRGLLGSDLFGLGGVVCGLWT